VSGSVLGVDLGGTKVAVAPLRDRKLGDSVIQPTRRSSGTELIEQIVEMVTAARGDDLAAVGVGVPSVVEFETGRVVSSVNVPLAKVPLRQVLGDRLGVPVFVDNDTNVAALAEAHDEQLELVTRHLVMFAVGAGIGVLNGRSFLRSGLRQVIVGGLAGAVTFGVGVIFGTTVS
jgi:glucokinase